MLPYTVVDAFTSEPLSGNPVAVCFDADHLDASTMQRIANEMHLSETTFVLRPSAGGDARVRIFTPVNELPFAGHPILGTALALAQRNNAWALELETAMGIVHIEVEPRGDLRGRVRMSQPVPVSAPYRRSVELLAALGVEAPALPVSEYRNGPRHVLVGLGTLAELSALSPDHRRLAEHEDMAAICFAEAGDHWRMRMFSPAYGVVEDAATGSAAGPLAIHLASHGRAGFGDQVRIRQGVELGRPSDMIATAQGSGTGVESVAVSGDAVTVARGTLLV
ncbi:PhzF family phenazine biosynthesis protein [Nocardia altamirensis]|uniref:PhzF family phenazine biosynthesis protein n=1 Tax=Nocardia altamirensis TaxID=472158 RepID=UPI000840719E|nr:PhzF family phenazine biosynthesis isomerase [Nocardia altamirensis]